MDERNTKELRKQVNMQSWTRAAIIAAWRTWAPKQAVLLQEATRCMLERARPRPGMRVLDLASGPGSPAIQLAEAVAPDGRVTATDLSEEMLATARQNAGRAGVSNMIYQQADAHSLPFDDDSFDVVTCRFGIMYFADVQAALAEVRRVLIPGGRAVFMSWGPKSQPFFSTTDGIVRTYLEMPMDPNAPDTFAFAPPGALAEALDAAGFHEVAEEALSIAMHWPGTASELWEFFQEVTASFAEMRRRVPGDWQRIGQEVVAALSQYQDGDRVSLPGLVNQAYGIEP